MSDPQWTRRTEILGMLSIATATLPDEAGAAKPRKSTSGRRSRARGLAGGLPSTKSEANSGEGCACGSGKVCVGPRGGRYCITSSGRKRYGQ